MPAGQEEVVITSQPESTPLRNDIEKPEGYGGTTDKAEKLTEPPLVIALGPN